jgi:hypothetical protein
VSKKKNSTRKLSAAEPTIGQSRNTTPTAAEIDAMTDDVLHKKELAAYEAHALDEALAVVNAMNRNTIDADRGASPIAVARNAGQPMKPMMSLADVAARSMSTGRNR